MASGDTAIGRLRLGAGSTRALERSAWFTLAVLWLVVTTGGLVRLTASGLGCPDWPNCAPGSLIPPGSYHAVIEYSNRIISGIGVLATLVTAVLAQRSPQAPSWLRRVAWAVAAGTAAPGPARRRNGGHGRPGPARRDNRRHRPEPGRRHVALPAGHGGACGGHLGRLPGVAARGTRRGRCRAPSGQSGAGVERGRHGPHAGDVGSRRDGRRPAPGEHRQADRPAVELPRCRLASRPLRRG